MSQVAKLHIRGNLVNTLQRLTLAESLEAQKAANVAFNDPALGAARTEFCAALARTIGSEYKDVDVALTEVSISFWISSVDILYHRPKKFIIELIGSTCAECKHTSLAEANQRRKQRAARYSKKDGPNAAQIREILNTKISDLCDKCGGNTRLVAPKDLTLLSTDEVERIYTELTGHTAPDRDRTLIDVPIQRKKFFQTCLFNYLRQILRENTYPKTTGMVSVYDHADVVIVKTIRTLLDQSSEACKYRESKEAGKTIFSIQHPYKKNKESDPKKKLPADDLPPGACMLTLDDVSKLDLIVQQARAYGVEVIANEPTIMVCAPTSTQIINGNVMDKTRVHQISLDSSRNEDGQDASYREHIESQNEEEQSEKAFTTHDVDYNDSANVVRDRLSENGQKIFDLIIHPSDEYMTRYGSDRVCKAHIAEFLGFSPKEVQRQWDIIELQMRAVDLVPQ